MKPLEIVLPENFNNMEKCATTIFSVKLSFGCTFTTYNDKISEKDHAPCLTLPGSRRAYKR